MLESVLLSVEALITYRRRYQRDMNMANGLDLLLLESGNPRSIVFQLDELGRHLETLPSPVNGSRLSAEKRLLLEATSSLRLCDMTKLALVEEENFVRSNLGRRLARIQYLVSDMAVQLSDEYFDHAQEPQPLVQGDWGDLL